MIWLNPLAWLGLVVLVAPVVIHILVHRRAEQFSFPTLRFVLPTRLAAIRRHVLDDLPLLIVRAGILAAAVGALAAPLLLTAARRQAWNARTVRAVVQDGANPGAAPSAFRSRIFETRDLRDGVRRATRWLDSAPPARRELLISAPLALGSIAQEDLSAVPPEIGIRFVRSGALPAERSLSGTAVLSGDLNRPGGADLRERTIELSGASTSVRESPGVPSMVPIEIVATPEDRTAAEAALTAVLSQRVPAPLPGRRARVVFAGSTQPGRTATIASPTEPWVADAIARIARDEDLRQVSADGTPLIAATSDGPILIVRTAAPATSIATVRLFRSMLNALANPSEIASGPSTTAASQSPTSGVPAPNIGDTLQPAVGAPTGRTARVGDFTPRVPNGMPGVPWEILPIPDALLRAWERPAGEVRMPRLETLEHDDRRWWWASALLLLVLETWMRRARTDRVANATPEEAARVA